MKKELETDARASLVQKELIPLLWRLGWDLGNPHCHCACKRWYVLKTLNWGDPDEIRTSDVRPHGSKFSHRCFHCKWRTIFIPWLICRSEWQKACPCFYFNLDLIPFARAGPGHVPLQWRRWRRAQLWQRWRHLRGGVSRSRRTGEWGGINANEPVTVGGFIWQNNKPSTPSTFQWQSTLCFRRFCVDRSFAEVFFWCRHSFRSCKLVLQLNQTPTSRNGSRSFVHPTSILRNDQKRVSPHYVIPGVARLHLKCLPQEQVNMVTSCIVFCPGLTQLYGQGLIKKQRFL